MKNNYSRKTIHCSETEILVIKKTQVLRDNFRCALGKLGSTKRSPLRTFPKFISLKSKSKHLLLPADHLCSDRLVIPAAHKQIHATCFSSHSPKPTRDIAR